MLMRLYVKLIGNLLMQSVHLHAHLHECKLKTYW